jgi:hypothetical protein
MAGNAGQGVADVTDLGTPAAPNQMPRQSDLLRTFDLDNCHCKGRRESQGF